MNSYNSGSNNNDDNNKKIENSSTGGGKNSSYDSCIGSDVFLDFGPDSKVDINDIYTPTSNYDYVDAPKKKVSVKKNKKNKKSTTLGKALKTLIILAVGGTLAFAGVKEFVNDNPMDIEVIDELKYEGYYLNDIHVEFEGYKSVDRVEIELVNTSVSLSSTTSKYVSAYGQVLTKNEFDYDCHIEDRNGQSILCVSAKKQPAEYGPLVGEYENPQYVTIYIPENTDIDLVDISTSKQNVSVDLNHIDVDELTIECKDAWVSVNRSQIKEIDITNSGDDIYLSNVTAENVYISGKDSYISIYDSMFSERAEIEGDNTCVVVDVFKDYPDYELEINTSGDYVFINLDGDIDDYMISATANPDSYFKLYDDFLDEYELNTSKGSVKIEAHNETGAINISDYEE